MRCSISTLPWLVHACSSSLFQFLLTLDGGHHATDSCHLPFALDLLLCIVAAGLRQQKKGCFKHQTSKSNINPSQIFGQFTQFFWKSQSYVTWLLETEASQDLVLKLLHRAAAQGIKTWLFSCKFLAEEWRQQRLSPQLLEEVKTKGQLWVPSDGPEKARAGCLGCEENTWWSLLNWMRVLFQPWLVWSCKSGTGLEFWSVFLSKTYFFHFFVLDFPPCLSDQGEKVCWREIERLLPPWTRKHHRELLKEFFISGLGVLAKNYWSESNLDPF